MAEVIFLHIIVQIYYTHSIIEGTFPQPPICEVLWDMGGGGELPFLRMGPEFF